MYHHNHTQIPGLSPVPRVTNRMPQFNKDYCGFHCGEGCEPYDVGRTESDTSATLVTENGTDPAGLLTPAHAHSEASLLSLSCAADSTGVEPDNGHLTRNGSIVPRNGSFPSRQSSRYYDDGAEGPRNFLSSGTHSARSFGSRSIGTVSPSAWLMETGGWASGVSQAIDHQVRRLPPVYYFLETPLRLSPDEHSGSRPESPW